jgi:beta-galactosidase
MAGKPEKQARTSELEPHWPNRTLGFMKNRLLVLLASLVMLASGPNASGKSSPHTFALGTNDFLLDGKPFQIRSGEIHPGRIPKEYWRQRIQMAKAMGLNTIAAYIFWNYHEVQEGRFDFKSDNRDLPEFFRIVQEEGMWVFLRPGPYCCAEYDFGGIPPYLLRSPDLKVRCLDPRYRAAAEQYCRALGKVIRPWQITQGGPILLLQVENEYGSYGNDRDYLFWLRDLWRRLGITVPFSTGDGATTYMLEAGALPGCAVGLDPGGDLKDWELARRMNPGVPVFSSETYPGWLTHWGESWATVGTQEISKDVRFLLDHGKSFNLYMFHGGTSFGFTAGANADRLAVSSNGLACSFMPDLTSYDYDAPVTEQGRPTAKYAALRELISSYLPKGENLPPVPEPIPARSIAPIQLTRWTTLWDHLPKPVRLAQPKPFEMLGQTHGLMLYRTKLVGHHSGRLVVRDLNDYGLVFVDGKFIGSIDRRLGQNDIQLPKTDATEPTLEILVEAMGHINFGEFIIDRKGITERVTLNGMTLMNWEVFPFPLDEKWIASLGSSGSTAPRPGGFFKGTFELDQPADTFFDLSEYQKGYVWVNGHNLGRYWNIGPQQRLYCPASWLRTGRNEIVVLDLHLTEPKRIAGKPTLTAP